MPLYALAGLGPAVHPTAWVAPSAELIADVHLAEEASVWFGAVVRADNTPFLIGPRTNVQEGATLHSDPGAPLSIGADCTIGHRAILHGCTVGTRVLIGMGAIVLNRAEIGDECIVGAGALVTEGKTFPPRSLIVGSPARAVRRLDEEAVAMLRASAAHYAARAHTYAADLARVD